MPPSTKLALDLESLVFVDILCSILGTKKTMWPTSDFIVNVTAAKHTFGVLAGWFLGWFGLAGADLL